MTRAMKNTLRCVLVLFIISAVSVALLAVANTFLKVVPRLDEKTAAIINRIAPTGVDSETAFKEKYIKMVDISSAGYEVTDLAAFNAAYGGNGTEVLALYTSTRMDTGKTTFVVEAKSPGYVADIVMLVAYDENNAISGIEVKSQKESYWNELERKIGLEKFYAFFIGKSGAITSTQIRNSTGATIMGTLGGVARAVSIANEFVVSLGGAPVEPPSVVTDADFLQKLQRLSDGLTFTKYPVSGADKKKVSAVYVADNGDIIYQSHGNYKTYGNVEMLVIANNDKTLKKLILLNTSFMPDVNHDSSVLTDTLLNNIFAGKSADDIKGMSGSLPGSTGVTDSSNGVREAVLNALEYIDKFDKGGAGA